MPACLVDAGVAGDALGHVLMVAAQQGDVEAPSPQRADGPLCVLAHGVAETDLTRDGAVLVPQGNDPGAAAAQRPAPPSTTPSMPTPGVSRTSRPAAAGCRGVRPRRRWRGRWGGCCGARVRRRCAASRRRRRHRHHALPSRSRSCRVQRCRRRSATSSASVERNSRPRRAAAPSPAAAASGCDSASAHGHATTSTATVMGTATPTPANHSPAGEREGGDNQRRRREHGRDAVGCRRLGAAVSGKPAAARPCAQHRVAPTACTRTRTLPSTSTVPASTWSPDSTAPAPPHRSAARAAAGRGRAR
jgi:hypothetical protein